MSRATRSTDITSFTDVRRNLRQHLDRVTKTGRPLYITTSGQPEAVVLSADAYDDLLDRADLAQTAAMARASERDFSEGRFQEAGPALRALAKKQFTRARR